LANPLEEVRICFILLPPLTLTLIPLFASKLCAPVIELLLLYCYVFNAILSALVSGTRKFSWCHDTRTRSFLFTNLNILLLNILLMTNANFWTKVFLPLL
jgi:hypothetical protein